MNRTKINNSMKENKRENIIGGDIDLGKFFQMALSYKIYVTGLNLHETLNKNLIDYKGDFETNTLMVIGPVEYKTNIRFKNILKVM